MLTRIECEYLTGGDLARSAFVMLNPWHQPGELLVVGATAPSGELPSQVGCRLAIDYLVESVSASLVGGLQGSSNGPSAWHRTAVSPTAQTSSSAPPATPQRPKTGIVSHDPAATLNEWSALETLRRGFQFANASLNSFGKGFVGGGRIAASLSALIVRGGSAAVARVGDGSAYLYRHGELYGFFEGAAAKNQALLGVNQNVEVEFASVDVSEFDTLLFSSETLNGTRYNALNEYLPKAPLNRFGRLNGLVSYLSLQPSYLSSVWFGPDALFLDTVEERTRAA